MDLNLQSLNWEQKVNNNQLSDEIQIWKLSQGNKNSTTEHYKDNSKCLTFLFGPSLYLVSVLIYDYRIQEFPFISLINQTKTLKLGQWK